MVPADGDRLQQVFQNLLSNAIKYRSERSLEIHVACRRVAGEWIISVSDNGIGIDKRYAERISGFSNAFTVRTTMKAVALGWQSAGRLCSATGGASGWNPNWAAVPHFILPYQSPKPSRP